MYISKESKIAFFTVPRTGSNSAQYVLENSGLFPSTVTNLDEIIDTPIDGNNMLVEGSREGGILDNYHLSPTQAIDRGLVTVEELREFNSFAFVRNPLDRWVSRFMLAKSYGLWEGDDRDTMILAIRHGLFEGRADLKLNFKWSYRDYFYHNNERVVTPYRIEDMDTVLNDAISSSGGTVVITPRIQLGDGTPDHVRNPESWLPADCITLLRMHYAEDFELYESLS